MQRENVNEQPQSLIVNGQKYVLVGLSPSSAPTSGFLKEGTTHVVYEYEMVAPTNTNANTRTYSCSTSYSDKSSSTRYSKTIENVTKETVDPTFKRDS